MLLRGVYFGVSLPVTQRRKTTTALPSCSRHNANLVFAGIQEPSGQRSRLLLIALWVALRAIGYPSYRNVERVSILLVGSSLGTSAFGYTKIGR